MNHISKALQVSLLSLLSLVVCAAALAADDSSAASLDGSYKSAASAAQKEARQQSVDKTVSEFFFVTRGVARKRLEAKTKIAETVSIKRSKSEVSIHFEGRDVEVCPLSGHSKGKDPEGKETELAARLQGDTLVQTVTTDEGQRTNTFKPQADGSLQLTVELTSKKFETPIRYTVTYRKAS
jgi:hypothetical protein